MILVTSTRRELTSSLIRLRVRRDIHFSNESVNQHFEPRSCHQVILFCEVSVPPFFRCGLVSIRTFSLKNGEHDDKKNYLIN